MSNRPRTLHDAEFKRRVVEFASDPGITDARSERDHWLDQGAIRHWRAELEEDPVQASQGKGTMRPVDEQPRRLRRETEILQQGMDPSNVE